MERSGATHLDLGPSNIFLDKKSGDLVCIDPNAFYCKGSFVGDDIGHRGMYGTEMPPSHVTCLLAHRFPLKLMKFSLDLIKSGIKTEDTNSVWTHFNNTDDAIFLSKEEIDVIAFPNWPDNKDKLVELKLQLSEKFNLQPKKVNDWINQFDCERSIYTFDLN